MSVFLARLRRWFRWPFAERASFDELRRVACDEPLMAISARGLIQSLSPQPECGSNSYGDHRRHVEAIRFRQRLSTMKTR